MAFQEVNTSGSFVNLTKLKIGESYTGYVVKFTTTKLRGKDVSNIVMKNSETNEQQTVGASGNLRYLVEDGKIEAGLLTRITRIDDKKVGGLMSSQFRVEQDSDQSLSDHEFEAVPAADLKASTKELAADKVRREAEALSARASGGARK